MATIAENLQTLITNKANIKSAIEGKVGETITPTMSQWPSIIQNIPTGNPTKIYMGTHVDENGVWHKPADWPDIESLPLPSGYSTVYLLFGNHVTENSFAYFTASRYSSSYPIDVDKGTIVNGEFVVTENIYHGQSNYTHSEWLSDSQDDYTIYRVQAERLGGVVLLRTSITIDSKSLVSDSSTCLMRYGNLPYGTSPRCRNFYIESDNIIDLAKENTGDIDASSNNGYGSCFNLQRWRHTGWNTANVTTFASTFSNCYSLSDIDKDLTGFVTSKCTSLAYMFYNCYSLPELNVTNWNTSEVTTTFSMFSTCYNLRTLTGIDTWTNLSKATTLANMFANCKSLEGDLDLENFAITDDCTTFAYTFYWCEKLDTISLKGWDMSKATAINYMFTYCSNLRSIDFTGITPITSTCTAVNQMLYYCANITELTLNGWDFSGVTNATNMGHAFIYMYGCRKLEFKNCTFPTSLTNAGTSIATSPVSTMPLARYLDYSDMYASAYNGSTGFYTAFVNSLYLCEDFYPPQNIGKAFNISNCQALSHDSIVRIFNALATVTGTVKLTMGTNITKVSAAEIAIATNKGWTVSQT